MALRFSDCPGLCTQGLCTQGQVPFALEHVCSLCGEHRLYTWGQCRGHLGLPLAGKADASSSTWTVLVPCEEERGP